MTGSPYWGDERENLIAVIERAMTDAGATFGTEGPAAAILAAADAYADAGPVSARCPVCVVPGPGPLSGEFTARTGDELFAMIAGHVMQVHNGGGADAFSTAESVLPHIGQRWRRRAAADPDAYRAPSPDGSTPTERRLG